MKRIALMLGLLSTAAVLSGCASSKTETLVAILPPAMSSPFHVQIAAGTEEQGKTLGWNVQVQSPNKETDFSEQVAHVETFVVKNADAISINAIDDKAIQPAIAKANKANIPIFVHNSLTPVGKDVKVAEYIGYNQRLGAKQCGRYLGKLMGGKGKVFVLQGIPGFHTNEREGGFREGLAEFPGIKVVGAQPANWEREKAVNVTSDVLRKNPDVNAIFACSDEMAIGASIAANRAAKKIYTIGIDGNPATLEEIKKGNVTATLGVYPKKIGETIIIQMQKVMKGEKIPAFLETPSVVVHKDNIADYESEKLWTEPKAGEAEVEIEK